jgi:hypothetical protein
MTYDPPCLRCGERFSRHLIFHDPADVPPRAKEGIFEGVETSGQYCRPPVKAPRHLPPIADVLLRVLHQTLGPAR